MSQPGASDSAFGRIPKALDWNEDYTGPAVLLLAGSADQQWSADQAIALASAWARSGLRVVLADFHLEDPVLHERLGVENLDGAVDLCLYGISLPRSARRIPGSGFHLIPAGSYTPDPGSIFGHPRWLKVVEGFREAGAWLLVYVPADTPDLPALAEWATDAILLGEPSRHGRAPVVPPPGLRIHAVTEPHVEIAAPAVEPEPVAEEVIEAAEPEPEAGAPVPQPTEPDVVPDEAAPPAPAPVAEPVVHVASAPQLTREPPVAAERTRRGRPLLWVLLALLVLGGLTALLFAWNAGMLRRELIPVPAPEPVAPPVVVAPPAPLPNGVALPYSVYVRAFRSYPGARRRAEREQQRFPETPFYISVEPEQGIPYYKVFAGLMADTAAATALRDRLVEAGVVDRNDIAAASTRVQTTPLAFDLGEFATQEEAVAQADSLARSDVPAYAVALPYSDGTNRWRLYSGAFPDSASADSMRSMLIRAGQPARLVERVGPGVGS